MEVKVCAEHKNISVSNAPWSLVGADSSNNSDIVVGGGLKEPQYPGVDDPLPPGKCVLGWITFQVPTSERIVAAKYAPSSRNGVYAEWRVR